MAAATAPSSDRLSDLPDDLLIHILSFAPSHEAARTTALSRRWRRQLWRETAAANLDYSSCSGVYDKALFCAYSRGREIKKLNITMRDRDITDADLCPAGDAGVEELRLECQDGGCPRYTYAGPSPESLWFDLNLSLDWLPWESLRVLDLTGCNIPPFTPEDVPDWDYLRYSYMPSPEEDIAYDSSPPPPPPHVAFPCLDALRLRRCAVYKYTLQAFIDGAPRLTDLCLESLSVLQHCTGQLQIPVHLRCVRRNVLESAQHPKRGVAISLYNGTRGYNTIYSICIEGYVYTV
ncbi:hypothetical protein D1007_47351 [Hordeum vulgare]|nr:hypothetical protein D1007_47351 [Hordeum vulgare]